MKVVLVSTYELGHQPFGLASPAAWLKAAGADVTCLDLAVSHIDHALVAQADLIAVYVPMHTATRLAAQFIPRLRATNPRAHLCAYGLYAPLNAAYLRDLGVQTILGGEFEASLAALYRRLAEATAPSEAPLPEVSLARQRFLTPDRSTLPHLSKYAYLERGDGCRKVVGYTEATRGCKHQCRHCPIVPVYGGQFRVVALDVVMDDIEQQMNAGAGHITFGDPDFFNAPGHAIPIVEKLHQLWPYATYDVTIKIEHLLKHRRWLPVLRDTGCLFVTSAVESVDDRVLAIFDKRHTRADFVEATRLLREHDLNFQPTFVAFHPWLSLDGYLDLLQTIADLDLIANVPPIQYAIRLLIPAGSKLLELPAVQHLIGPFDRAALAYPWAHPDPRVDQLQAAIFDLVAEAQAAGLPRGQIFDRVWATARAAAGLDRPAPSVDRSLTPIPHLSEDWYC
jgi:radical SAM superfamily enzyme YgiQ (UPF0313 family)